MKKISTSSFYKWKRIVSNFENVETGLHTLFMPLTVDRDIGNLDDSVCVSVNGLVLKCNKSHLVEIICALI